MKRYQASHEWLSSCSGMALKINRMFVLGNDVNPVWNPTRLKVIGMKNPLKSNSLKLRALSEPFLSLAQRSINLNRFLNWLRRKCRLWCWKWVSSLGEWIEARCERSIVIKYLKRLRWLNSEPCPCSFLFWYTEWRQAPHLWPKAI
jgi:hypothetical protein